MGVRFSRDSDEEMCGKTVIKVFNRKKIKCACLRTAGHSGKHVSMSYDAAKADGVCYGCRAKVGEEHGFFDKKRRIKCDAANYMVECAFCYARFSRAFNLVSYTNGADCASQIVTSALLGRRSLLQGGYGSIYDYETYRFVDGIPVGYENANPVCDGCIRGFIEQGALEKVL